VNVPKCRCRCSREALRARQLTEEPIPPSGAHPLDGPDERRSILGQIELNIAGHVPEAFAIAPRPFSVGAQFLAWRLSKCACARSHLVARVRLVQFVS